MARAITGLNSHSQRIADGRSYPRAQPDEESQSGFAFKAWAAASLLGITKNVTDEMRLLQAAPDAVRSGNKLVWGRQLLTAAPTNSLVLPPPAAARFGIGRYAQGGLGAASLLASIPLLKSAIDEKGFSGALGDSSGQTGGLMAASGVALMLNTPSGALYRLGNGAAAIGGAASILASLPILVDGYSTGEGIDGIVNTRSGRTGAMMMGGGLAGIGLTLRAMNQEGYRGARGFVNAATGSRLMGSPTVVGSMAAMGALTFANQMGAFESESGRAKVAAVAGAAGGTALLLKSMKAQPQRGLAALTGALHGSRLGLLGVGAATGAALLANKFGLLDSFDV